MTNLSSAHEFICYQSHSGSEKPKFNHQITISNSGRGIVLNLSLHKELPDGSDYETQGILIKELGVTPNDDFTLLSGELSAFSIDYERQVPIMGQTGGLEGIGYYSSFSGSDQDLTDFYGNYLCVDFSK